MHNWGWTAYVDESEPDSRADPGVYLLAAALVEDGKLDDINQVLRSLLLPGQRKLHWHDESAPRRQRLSSALADLDMLHMVVVRVDGHPEERSERRRRLCLERLLIELDHAGVVRVICEARQQKQNQADRAMLDALRARRQLTGNVRMDHVPGPDNPILAAADIVCGAVAADRRGESSYLAQLKPLMTMHTLHRCSGC